MCQNTALITPQEQDQTGQLGSSTTSAQNPKDSGLVYTPKDVEGGLGSLLGQLVGKVLGFLGIEFASTPSGDRLGDPPIPIPLPTNLLWIDQIVNGNGWEDHGQFDFESKEEYREMVLDTVQNAEGKDIVRNPQGRKGVTGFRNDEEGCVVWRDKNHPDHGTAFHPDEPDRYKKEWDSNDNCTAE